MLAKTVKNKKNIFLKNLKIQTLPIFSRCTEKRFTPLDSTKKVYEMKPSTKFHFAKPPMRLLSPEAPAQVEQLI